MCQTTIKDSLALELIDFLDKENGEYHYLEWDNRKYDCINGFNPVFIDYSTGEEKPCYTYEDRKQDTKELLEIDKPFIYMFVGTNTFDMFQDKEYWQYWFGDNVEEDGYTKQQIKESHRVYRLFRRIIRRYNCDYKFIDNDSYSGHVLIYEY